MPNLIESILSHGWKIFLIDHGSEKPCGYAKVLSATSPRCHQWCPGPCPRHELPIPLPSGGGVSVGKTGNDSVQYAQRGRGDSAGKDQEVNTSRRIVSTGEFRGFGGTSPAGRPVFILRYVLSYFKDVSRVRRRRALSRYNRTGCNGDVTKKGREIIYNVESKRVTFD